MVVLEWQPVEYTEVVEDRTCSEGRMTVLYNEPADEWVKEHMGVKKELWDLWIVTTKYIKNMVAIIEIVVN
jgi:hypothetical protein